MTATPAERHASRAVRGSYAAVVASLLFGVVGGSWSYLRLLLCTGSRAVPLCTQTFAFPVAVFGLVALAFALVLFSLSNLAGVHGSKLHFAHPRRPIEGLRRLSEKSHRRAVRVAHVFSWTSAGAFFGFLAWFELVLSDLASALLALGLALGSIAVALTLLAEEKEISKENPTQPVPAA
jgi:hypothetical protein